MKRAKLICGYILGFIDIGASASAFDQQEALRDRLDSAQMALVALLITSIWLLLELEKKTK